MTYCRETHLFFVFFVFVFFFCEEAGKNVIGTRTKSSSEAFFYHDFQAS